MSLVAYAVSSDEDSEHEENESEKIKTVPVSNKVVPLASKNLGEISDEDENYASTDTLLNERRPSAFSLTLPKPKNPTTTSVSIREEIEEQISPAFARLPLPKTKTASSLSTVIEEDDEFLRKKATLPSNSDYLKPSLVIPQKAPAKISIPALKDFKDVEDELANKLKNKKAPVSTGKGCGLLEILPRAKSEQNFAIAKQNSNDTSSTKKPDSPANLVPHSKPAFIPDAVKSGRRAQNTEGVDGISSLPRKSRTAVKGRANESKNSLVNASDSEASDDEESGGDFFSLNASEELPEVSANEINAMVAKRAVKMAEVANKYLTVVAETQKIEKEQQALDEAATQESRKRYHEKLDEEAMQALVGSSVKRQRKQKTQIQIMDISSDQVLPNREEWMRTALSSSTAYQPTGVLVDEEPAVGTRRKHQITYLAHKAKANEAELQAMWSANRQNRRATQSKYGF